MLASKVRPIFFKLTPQHGLFLYFLFLCLITPFRLLSFDTYYYWDWSRHLDLSYYDGPPLIAYMIRLLTLVMGDMVFGLALFSLIMTMLTAYMLYKTASLFLKKDISCWVVLIWLSAPLVTQDMLMQVTYDTPMTYFWVCSLYYAMRYILFQKTRSIYALALCFGFLLLSKYTGIVLILGVLCFVLTTDYIRLLKTPHFYIAMGLTSMCFFPVIFWNMQHHWISLTYQWQAHQALSTHGVSLWLQTVFTKVIPSLNIMILLPFFVIWMQRRAFSNQESMLCSVVVESRSRRDGIKFPNFLQYLTNFRCNVTPEIKMIRFLLMVTFVFIGFHFALMGQSILRVNWLAPYWLMAALLSGWVLQSQHILRLSSKSLLIFRGYVSLSILISALFLLNACLHVVPSKNYIDYQLIQSFNDNYPEKLPVVLTTGWMSARVLFFLKNKPIIYTVDCGQAQNAYQQWSASFETSHFEKILAINFYDNRSCLLHYFQKCEQYPTTSIAGKSLFVYQCERYRERAVAV